MKQMNLGLTDKKRNSVQKPRGLSSTNDLITKLGISPLAEELFRLRLQSTLVKAKDDSKLD